MRCIAIALMTMATALDAQTTVRAATPLLSAPNGKALATLRTGASVRALTGAAASRQGHTQVTLDGFVDASLLGSGRDSFPIVVKAPRGARLRSAGRSSASVVADLRDGMGVSVISRAGTWVRVRRTAWVANGALGPPPAPLAARAAGAGGARPDSGSIAPSVPNPALSSSSAANPPPAGAVTPAASIEMRTAPEGKTTARIDSGAFLTPLARADGWTRVRLEGWVRDDEVVPADTALRLSLSGADVRAAPERYRGTVVRWDVEYIAMQRADPLRRDMRSGEPYLLARGPGEESGLLYIAVPPALVAEVERFQPLQVVTVTARIRVGRSEPAGVPILDLIAAARK